MEKAFISDMTWEECNAAVDYHTIAILPLGSTEIEGSHLPLGVDTITAHAIAERLAGETGVLIGPTLPIGYSKWFRPFSGTISLEYDTFTRVLIEYSKCLIDNGIKRLLFLNSHKGNSPAIQYAAHILMAEQSILVSEINIWKLANDLIKKTNGLITENKFTHGGEIMTSMMMALNPELVVTGRMKTGSVISPPNSGFKFLNSTGETEFLNSVQTVYQRVNRITDSGILGDPMPASSEKGRTILKMLVAYIKAFLKEFKQLPVDK